MTVLINISWESAGVLLKERVFLFCLDEKCMSGKISKLKKTELSISYEAEVNFIEPSFFKKDLFIGVCFTIREGNKILGRGRVLKVEY
jgi:hypothetical protein